MPNLRPLIRWPARTRRVAHGLGVTLCCVLVGLVSTWASTTQAQSDDPDTTARTLAFRQQDAELHMRQLETRMAELARLIEAEQPDEARRLTMAIAMARDEALADRMTLIVGVLNASEYESALSEQQAVLNELIELRAFLLRGDIGLEETLSDLEALHAAMEELSHIIEAEQGQLAATESLEAEGGEPTEAEQAAMDELANGEARNEQRSENLNAQLGELNAETGAASEAMQSAQQSMGEAQESLQQGESGEAGEEQEQALDDLERAMEELERAEEEMQEKLENEARKRVIENLETMLAKQIEVREATQRLAPRAQRGQVQALIAVERLSPHENEITELCRDTIEICVLVQFSVALPPALRLIEDRTVWMQQDLTQRRSGENVIREMQRIELEIATLIDVMNEQQANQQQEQQQSEEQQQEQEEMNTMNEILAELRILRQLQWAVNDQTTVVDGQRVEGRLQASEAASRIVTLSDRQAEIREAMDALRELAQQ